MPARQSGTWPTHRSGGLPHQVARAAGNIDAHDAGSWRQRRVACRQGRSEDREHRRADRGGEVHRSGVAGDEQRQPFEDGTQDDEVGFDRKLYERHIRRPRGSHPVKRTAIGRGSDQDNFRSTLRASSAPTSANRAGSHSLICLPAAGWMPIVTPPGDSRPISSAARRRASSGILQRGLDDRDDRPMDDRRSSDGREAPCCNARALSHCPQCARRIGHDTFAQHRSTSARHETNPMRGARQR